MSKPPGWLLALRARRYQQVEALLDERVPASEQSAMMRLVRGFVAHQRGQSQQVLSLLDGLETELPQHRERVLRIRAEAELRTERAEQGAKWLVEREERTDAWVVAAEAAAEQKRWDAAIQWASVAIQNLEKQPSPPVPLLARARAARATAYLQTNQSAKSVPDWYWLATKAPTQQGELEADRQYEQTSGSKLTAAERMARAVAMADAGQVERTERELARWEAAPGYAPFPARVMSLRGRARNRGRIESKQGAEWLEQSLEFIVQGQESVLMEAATLHTRAGSPDQAVRLYDRLAAMSGNHRERALYMAARASRVAGKLQNALARFDAMLRQFPKGRLFDSAVEERAFVQLLLGKPQLAGPAFDELAKKEQKESARLKYEYLAAMAALGAERQDEAAERFTRIVRQQPLTMYGLFARSRLRRLKAPVPVVLTEDAPPPAAPVEERLPGPVIELVAVGLVDLAAEALREQEPLLLPKYGTRYRQILCQAWGSVGTADRRYAMSRDATGELALDRPPTAWTRWQWDCRYPRPYSELVEELERDLGLPRDLSLAVMRRESGFRPKVVSRAGAIGLMQLMPSTAERLSKQMGLGLTMGLEDPRTNCEFGAAYLRMLLDAFSGNLVAAVASYNAGPSAVLDWHKGAPSLELDLFAAGIPYEETERYVASVLSNLAVYAYLRGGERALPSLGLQFPPVTVDPQSLF